MDNVLNVSKETYRQPSTSLGCNSHSRCVTVRRVKQQKHLKKIIFTDDTPSLLLPHSASVRENDLVEFCCSGVFVVCENGKAQIQPSYVAREHLLIGNLDLEFIIKEITEADEMEAYRALTQFHYRSHVLFGRTARLVIRCFHPIYPKIVGYIELTTPFFMNKARARLLNAPFANNGIAWQSWDKTTRQKYINLFVRIARCVIYPEFRGLGLGQLLIRHTIEFARRHWQVSGLKPYFVEISADMLKYVPFAQKAGMTFIGETEGNLNRAARDMVYLLRMKKHYQDKYSNAHNEACGFLDQQMARANKAAELMEREGWELDELKIRLKGLEKTVSLQDYALFREIVSFPKPTYLKGLNTAAENFLRERSQHRTAVNGVPHALPPIDSLRSAVKLEKVSLSYQSRVRRTWQTQAIQQAFGISPDEILHPVIKDLSLLIEPGQIVLLTGPSGSGKSSLLRLFAEQTLAGSSGAISWPENYKPGVFAPFRSQKSLIEALGNYEVKDALHLMGLVGLSDAFIYLKRFDELSNGQQYRAMLVRLLISGCNIWLADEFCANLDTLTANLVADRLQKIARQVGAVVIAASSQPETFAAALRPDWVVNLTTAWEHSVTKGEEFMKSFRQLPASFNAPDLKIAAEYLPAVRAGHKTTTIRLGHKTLPKGLLLLKTRSEFEAVRITGIIHKTVRELTAEDAKKDGFATLEALKTALRKHYPGIGDNSRITIFSFELLSELQP